jgi:hypothetical protein
MHLPAMVGRPASHIGGGLQIDATRPCIESIESTLAARCGLSTLPAQIPESCIGVNCKPNGKAS